MEADDKPLQKSGSEMKVKHVGRMVAMIGVLTLLVPFVVSEVGVARPASAAIGGTITGTVTAATGGSALSGVCVRAVQTNGGTGNGTARTGATGTYAISGLPAGSYDVEFYGGSPWGGNYGPQWDQGQRSGERRVGKESRAQWSPYH